MSLNIFIFDKHNILVLQDITQPFAMDTAKQHLQANVLTWADNYSDIISMENKSLAGRTFLQMPAGWKMSVQLSERRLCKNFVINKYIQYDAQSTEVYPCIYVKVYVCIWVLLVCVCVCKFSPSFSQCMCVCVIVCEREYVWSPGCTTWEICLTFICLSFSFIKPLVF